LELRRAQGLFRTAVFTKDEPLAVTYGLGLPEHDTEGRLITLEFSDYFLLTVYTPNAQDGLARLDYRMAWEDAFRAHLKTLDARKPVISAGT
jgi:exodeoxyribonuclease-3